MPTKPTSTDYARWSDLGTNNIEAASGVKDAGYGLGDVAVSSYYNFTLNAIHDWLVFLDDPVGTGTNAAISATGSSTAGNIGLEGVAGGSHGYGLKGSGPVGSNLAAIYGVMGTGWGNPNAMTVGPDTATFAGGTLTDYAAYASSQNGPALCAIGGAGSSAKESSALIAIGRTGSPAAAMQGGIGVANSVYITAAHGNAGNAPGKYGLYCVSGQEGAAGPVTIADSAAIYAEGLHSAAAIYATSIGQTIESYSSGAGAAIYGENTSTGHGVHGVGAGSTQAGVYGVGGTQTSGNVGGGLGVWGAGGVADGSGDGGIGGAFAGGDGDPSGGTGDGGDGVESYGGDSGSASGIGGNGVAGTGGDGGTSDGYGGHFTGGGTVGIGLYAIGGSANGAGAYITGGAGNSAGATIRGIGTREALTLLVGTGPHILFDSTTYSGTDTGALYFDGTNLKFYDGAATKTISWT